jgi:hypothetical protein
MVSWQKTNRKASIWAEQLILEWVLSDQPEVSGRTETCWAGPLSSQRAPSPCDSPDCHFCPDSLHFFSMWFLASMTRRECNLYCVKDFYKNISHFVHKNHLKNRITEQWAMLRKVSNLISIPGSYQFFKKKFKRLGKQFSSFLYKLINSFFWMS